MLATIKAGKRYRRRDGKETGILVFNGKFYVDPESKFLYDINGNVATSLFDRHAGDILFVGEFCEVKPKDTKQESTHMTTEATLNNIRQWAHDRNLIGGSTAAAQMLKLTEEIKDRKGRMVDGVFVKEGD
jgi:hypothetical protein